MTKGLFIWVPKYHFLPKVLARCQNFGSEFWQGKTCQNFWHGISCRNSVPKFWAKIQAPCQNFWHKISAWKKLAGIFGLKTMPKFHAERIGLKWHFGGQMYRALVTRPAAGISNFGFSLASTLLDFDLFCVPFFVEEDSSFSKTMFKSRE